MIKLQRGQAMIEIFVAMAFILIPMLFLLTLLGKVGDVQHRAYEGARYVAWERAVTVKTDSAIRSEVNRRILYGVHRQVDSEKDRQLSSGDLSQLDNLYWHQNGAGEYERFLVDENKNFVEGISVNSKPKGAVHRARSSILNSGLVSYDLDERGMLSASVAHRIADSKWLTLGAPLMPDATHVMYTESWRQLSNGAVIDAMQGVVFGDKAFDNPVFEVMATAAEFIGFEEFGDFEPGFVRPDVVPCSRVVGGGSNRESACY